MRTPSEIDSVIEQALLDGSHAQIHSWLHWVQDQLEHDHEETNGKCDWRDLNGED